MAQIPANLHLPSDIPDLATWLAEDPQQKELAAEREEISIMTTQIQNMGRSEIPHHPLMLAANYSRLKREFD